MNSGASPGPSLTTTQNGAASRRAINMFRYQFRLTPAPHGRAIDFTLVVAGFKFAWHYPAIFCRGFHWQTDGLTSRGRCMSYLVKCGGFGVQVLSQSGQKGGAMSDALHFSCDYPASVDFANQHSACSKELDRLQGLFSNVATDATKILSIARLREALRHGQPGSGVHSAISDDDLASLFRSSAIPETTTNFAEYCGFLADVVLPHSINMGSPRCLGHMTGTPPPFMHEVADFVTRLNQNLVKADASRALTLIERQVLAMLHRVVFGREDDFYLTHIVDTSVALGMLVSGGTLANLTALWCARNLCFPAADKFRGVEHTGMSDALRYHGYEDAVIIGSELMHYSVHKAAAILGLGADKVIEIPVTADQRIDLNALERTVGDCARRRVRVIAIVGVAGSTDFGSIDPLPELSAIAKREGVHFHVDAAGSIGLLFSSRHSGLLAGIEDADSVAVDCHKQFCLPIGTGAILLKNPACARVLAKQAPYMLHSNSGDLGKFSVEGSRSGAALLIHAALNVIGGEGFASMVDHNLDTATALAVILGAAEDFELLQHPQTNCVLYRYLPPSFRARARIGGLSSSDNSELNRFNEKLQCLQYAAGRTHISRTTLRRVIRYPGSEIVALRAVINNILIRHEDLLAVLDDHRHIAAQIEAHGLN